MYFLICFVEYIYPYGNSSQKLLQLQSATAQIWIAPKDRVAKATH